MESVPCYIRRAMTERGILKIGRDDGKQGSTTESVRANLDDEAPKICVTWIVLTYTEAL